MKGGWNIEQRSNIHGNTWDETIFTDEEKTKIKKLGETEKDANKIREELFPGIPEINKANATYVIRNIAYSWTGA
jgi:hypothetical protein